MGSTARMNGYFALGSNTSGWRVATRARSPNWPKSAYCSNHGPLSAKPL